MGVAIREIFYLTFYFVSPGQRTDSPAGDILCSVCFQTRYHSSWLSGHCVWQGTRRAFCHHQRPLCQWHECSAIRCKCLTPCSLSSRTHLFSTIVSWVDTKCIPCGLSVCPLDQCGLHHTELRASPCQAGVLNRSWWDLAAGGTPVYAGLAAQLRRQKGGQHHVLFWHDSVLEKSYCTTEWSADLWVRSRRGAVAPHSFALWKTAQWNFKERGRERDLCTWNRFFLGVPLSWIHSYYLWHEVL